MFYIQINNKKTNNEIIKVLEEFNLSNKITEDINKSKVVILDEKITTGEIQELHNNKKIVIISYPKNIKHNDSIYYSSNVHTFNTINELREIIKYQIDKENKIKKIKLIIILIPIIILIILLIILFVQNMNNNKVKSEAKEPVKQIVKKVVKKETDIKKENIVFFGDSLISRYDLDYYYEGLPVINSGTGGFLTGDLLDSVKENVSIYNPTKVFILIGTNDIEYTDFTDIQIANRIKRIATLIKKDRPETEVYVESIYPVNRNEEEDIDFEIVGNRTNERIMSLNKVIEKICNEEDIKYINIYDLLLDENNELNIAYTKEGLHISDEGYEVITNKLMEYIK